MKKGWIKLRTLKDKTIGFPFSKIWILIILVILFAGGIMFLLLRENLETTQDIVSDKTTESILEERGDGWMIYRNESFSFLFAYPGDWEMEEQIGEAALKNKRLLWLSVSDDSHSFWILIEDNDGYLEFLSSVPPVTEEVIVEGVPQIAYVFPNGYECYEGMAPCSFFAVPIQHEGLWYYLGASDGEGVSSEIYKDIISTFRFLE